MCIISVYAHFCDLFANISGRSNAPTSRLRQVSWRPGGGSVAVGRNESPPAAAVPPPWGFMLRCRGFLSHRLTVYTHTVGLWCLRDDAAERKPGLTCSLPAAVSKYENHQLHHIKRMLWWCQDDPLNPFTSLWRRVQRAFYADLPDNYRMLPTLRYSVSLSRGGLNPFKRWALPESFVFSRAHTCLPFIKLTE